MSLMIFFFKRLERVFHSISEADFRFRKQLNVKSLTYSFMVHLYKFASAKAFPDFTWQ